MIGFERESGKGKGKGKGRGAEGREGKGRTSQAAASWVKKLGALSCNFPTDRGLCKLTTEKIWMLKFQFCPQILPNKGFPAPYFWKKIFRQEENFPNG